MLLAYRICKEEVIEDFYKEVKKVERVKVHSSRQAAFLQDMEAFLMVKCPPCPPCVPPPRRQRVPPVPFAVWIPACRFSEGRG